MISNIVNQILLLEKFPINKQDFAGITPVPTTLQSNLVWAILIVYFSFFFYLTRVN